jgi:osmotically-inducible protein OsmY
LKTLKSCQAALALAILALAGCSTGSTNSSGVAAGIRTSLDQADLKDVSVSQDLEKGVVTLSGHAAADREKAKAESIARSFAGNEVVSNQIAVLPPGSENRTAAINADLDKGIEGNLDAALLRDHLHEGVTYAVKNHVVTLTGAVDSHKKRARAEEVAAAVLNVQQVVNELQVKAQKASSSN